MGLFNNRKKINGKTAVPVWFMRQAGRYHQHYQNIKSNSDFMNMCKNPNLATEVTMGPIQDFGFDAAILFSDLLFPLEKMGLGLSYESGPPTLKIHLNTPKDFSNLAMLKSPPEQFYGFQGEACRLLRSRLPGDKDLLGFTGAPFTLYTYACEGSHSGNLIVAKQGLINGLFQSFLEIIESEIINQLSIQATNGADGLCLFDTAAGELSVRDFKNYIVPSLNRIAKTLKTKFPQKKIIYYSKFTHLAHLQTIECDHIDVLGVDWRHDIKEAINSLGAQYILQGNLDPSYLFYPYEHLQERAKELYQAVKDSKHGPDRWIMGLGHGVLPKTPEENVRQLVRYIQGNFIY